MKTTLIMLLVITVFAIFALAAYMYVYGGFRLPNRLSNVSTRPISPIQIVTPTSLPATPASTLITDAQVERQVKENLREKYNKGTENIDVQVQKQTKNHAFRTVNFQDDPGRSMWFAVKENNRWRLIFDGQNVIPCNLVN